MSRTRGMTASSSLRSGRNRGLDSSRMTVVDLRKELKSRGLNTVGNKAALMERLNLTPKRGVVRERKGTPEVPTVHPPSLRLQRSHTPPAPPSVSPHPAPLRPRSSERTPSQLRVSAEDLPSKPMSPHNPMCLEDQMKLQQPPKDSSELSLVNIPNNILMFFIDSYREQLLDLWRHSRGSGVADAWPGTVESLSLTTSRAFDDGSAEVDISPPPAPDSPAVQWSISKSKTGFSTETANISMSRDGSADAAPLDEAWNDVQNSARALNEAVRIYFRGLEERVRVLEEGSRRERRETVETSANGGRLQYASDCDLRNKPGKKTMRKASNPYLARTVAPLTSPDYSIRPLSGASTSRAPDPVSLLTQEDKHYLGGRLVFAARKGLMPDVRLFFEKGGDINYRDELKFSPLLSAANNGHYEVVKYLLDNGASINVFNNLGCSALHLATSRGKIDIVTLLLNKGVDINHRNSYGDTALHTAVYHSHEDIIHHLLKEGANVSIRNKKNSTAIQTAKDMGKEHIVLLLQKWQGNARS